ncbi:Crp/Fnr family transcriptional regulator [Chitinophaga pollutisoli]|uniref:Crp/Fnr family transcriptional regulator n=1 Tax=Chitinophaga pollutisoli TaxID=3133966 RepID=A0ABZ2YSQ1_9BACT
MKSWRHLEEIGYATAVPAEQREPIFGAMFQLFRSLYPQMDEELAAEIRARSEVVRFRRRAIILEYGEVCDHVIFPYRGLVRLAYRRDGEEHTTWMMGENDIIHAVDSFYSRQPSYERLIALEDTDGITLHWDDLEELYDQYPAFNRFGRLLTECYYRQAYRRAKWVALSAKERYRLLYKEYPGFLGRVPDAVLASYLGINKGTLSRIRHAVFRGRNSPFQDIPV